MTDESVRTEDESETRALAADLAKRLHPGDVLALRGPLGAGKTCFVRGLAEGLGIDPKRVSSPTFVLWHEYETDGGPIAALVHVDAYRLADPDELTAIGFEERLESNDAVFAIEWAERIESILPPDRIDITLEHAGANARHVTIRRLPG